MLFQRRQLLKIFSFAFGSNFIYSRDRFGICMQTAKETVSTPHSGDATISRDLAEGSEMEKVTGIGGLFFRASDPKALGRWYQQNLGISLTPSSHGDPVWQQEAGPTVFTPFPETTNYFGDAHKVWMVNFRVRDLDKMAAQLRAAGVEVKVDPQTYPIGRFARLHDPEGNPIELWQPVVPVVPR